MNITSKILFQSETNLSKCGVCKTTKIPTSQRYPNLVCGECIKKAVDIDGNIVTYSNDNYSGGFISYHHVVNSNSNANTIPNDNVEIVQKNDHDCWINGYKCYANEARFGGIVIELLEKDDDYSYI